MIKLIKSDDSFLLNCALNKEINNKKEFIKYYEDINNVLLDINQIQIFEENNVKVVKNEKIFANLESFKQNKQVLEKLININETIYFLANSKISSAKEIKDFLNNISVINVDSINQSNIHYYIQDKLKELNIIIGNELIEKISNKLICDANIINLEINKLSNWSDINENLIDKLICDWQSSNVFEMINLILKRDKKNVLYLYNSLIKQNYDEYALIQVLASQLVKFVVQKQLINMNYTSLQISDLLQMNQYIVNKNITFLKNIDVDFLKKICDDLYQLDIKIKLSLIDKNKSLKYFLLKL